MASSATQQPGAYACTTVTLAAAAFSLGLRIYARRLKRLKLWADDYLAMFAFIAATHYAIWVFIGLHNGLGLHLDNIPISKPDADTLRPKLTLIAEHTYTVSIATAQLSLVVLYWRVFQPVTGKRGIVLMVMGGFVITWFVVRVFISIFQCLPPQAYWDQDIDGRCPVDQGRYLIGSVASHLVTDLALMVFPAWQIRNLQLPLIQKFAVSGMFMFGIVVFIASIMMLVESVHYNVTSEDVMWSNVDAKLWSMVEINFSVMSACLPMMRPIVRLVGRKLSIRSPTTKRDSLPHAVFPRIQMGPGNDKCQTQDVESGVAPECRSRDEETVIYGQGDDLDTIISRRSEDSRGHVEDSEAAKHGVRIINNEDLKITGNER